MNYSQRILILDYLKCNDSITIHQVVELCGISIPTARKFLQILAKDNIIVFERGKATGTPSFFDSILNWKIHVNREEKESMAKYAAALVQPGQTVFIGGGSTTYFILPHIIHIKDITIVTNAMPILNFVIQYPQLKLIVLGGIWNSHAESLEGHPFQQMLDFYPDIAFIGAMGIDPQRGVTQNTPIIYQQESRVYQVSSCGYILVDSFKFETAFPWSILPSSAIRNIITTNKTSQDRVDNFIKNGVSVHIVS
ncbi:MAG: DeoR/GlpR family DNA-binding transcription regulator [Brevinema sp.]